MRNKWFMPFCRRLDMEYPSGIRHIIFNCATPISDGEIQVVQLLFRNDTEADCSAQELIDWDAAIIAEDRDMLEATDPDAIVDMGRKIEKRHAVGPAGHADAKAAVARSAACPQRRRTAAR